MTSRRWFTFSFIAGVFETFLMGACDNTSCANSSMPAGIYEIAGTDDAEIQPPMETGRLVYSKNQRLVTISYERDEQPRTVVLRVLELDDEGKPILPGGAGGVVGAGGAAQGGSAPN
ncbi:MAG TPA: hypothetical protein VLC09_02980 [Polyangiaceae bacterium]|nr:hypothetical protein [Polyangiaceae bacterium]